MDPSHTVRKVPGSEAKGLFSRCNCKYIKVLLCEHAYDAQDDAPILPDPIYEIEELRARWEVSMNPSHVSMCRAHDAGRSAQLS